MRLNSPIVGMTSTVSGQGYWLVAADGGIFAFGDAAFYGSTGSIHLNSPIVGMAATPSGRGYWLVAADGGIFAYGDARFFGSTGSIHLNSPIVGIAPTRSGQGYWMVGRDGGIFAYGDAKFYGSTGASQHHAKIVGIAATATGGGYWLAEADGAVFGFGDATFYGDAPASADRPVVGIVGTRDTQGYWLSSSAGDVYAFGDAAMYGSAGTIALNHPMVGLAGPRDGGGYWLVASDGGIFSYPKAVPESTSSTYAWMATNNDSSPVRYNPCATIHYVVNLTEAPAHALSDVQDALSRVSDATGMSFVYDGTSTEVPSPNRPVYQPATYGDRWAPVLIAWDRPDETAYLTAGAVADGGSSYLVTSQGFQYVTGEVALDATQAFPDGFDDSVAWGPLLLHELGHVIGVAHVDDHNQIMYPTVHPGGPRDYAAGDRAGLRLLGTASGCLTPVRPTAASNAGAQSVHSAWLAAETAPSHSSIRQ